MRSVVKQLASRRRRGPAIMSSGERPNAIGSTGADEQNQARFNPSGAGLVELKPKTLEIQRVSRRLCELLGYSAQELTGLAAPKLVDPARRKDFQDAMERLSRDDLSETALSTRLLDKNGSSLPVQLAAWPLIEKEDQASIILVAIQDVHGQNRTEEELRESEERYKLIVESALDYAIFVTDPDGRIMAWPPGAAAVFGWSPENIIGQPSSVLFTPEDLARGEAEKEFELAKNTGVAPDVRWHMREDGSAVFIEGWTRALRDSQGNIRGFLKIGQDVTTRRRMERALRESEERFRTLVISIPQLVFRCLATGERTWGSPQWEIYTGLSDTSSRGFGWTEAIHPEDRDATISAWQQAQSAGQYYIEHRIRRAGTSEYRWHQTRAVPIANLEQPQREWVGISVDVHDLRQLQGQQMVLVAELQHRTRNLLGVVQSLMQQTMMSSDSLETFGSKFNDRLAALSRVQGLLSRTDGKRITIGALVRMELDALGAEAISDRIVLDGPQVPMPNNVLQTLALAIHELATNARKHGALSTDRGTLTITWRLEATGDLRQLHLRWVEQGSHRRDRPPSSGGGFGRTLIEQALPASLGAKTSFVVDDNGVCCSILLPLQ